MKVLVPKEDTAQKEQVTHLVTSYDFPENLGLLVSIEQQTRRGTIPIWVIDSDQQTVVGLFLHHVGRVETCAFTWMIHSSAFWYHPAPLSV